MFIYTGKSITIADETLSSIRTVRGFNREESEYHRFMEETKKAVREDQKTGIFISFMYVLVDMGVWVIVIGNMYYGAQLVEKGELLASDLISLFGFLTFGCIGIVMLQLLM